MTKKKIRSSRKRMANRMVKGRPDTSLPTRHFGDTNLLGMILAGLRLARGK